MDEYHKDAALRRSRFHLLQLLFGGIKLTCIHTRYAQKTGHNTCGTKISAEVRSLWDCSHWMHARPGCVCRSTHIYGSDSSHQGPRSCSTHLFATMPTTHKMIEVFDESLPPGGARSSLRQPIYQPLDGRREEIRLLTLYPRLKDDATLRCTIHPAAFLSDTGETLAIPPYEGLSYVWGQPDFSSPILVNGQKLHITPSLATILSNLRRSTARMLWVDAICINQADLAERAQQVAIMKKVYSSCVRVIA